MPSEHKYYPALDGARAIAALMVLVFHGFQEGLPLPAIVRFGQTGVDLFFVLSGFLITSILLAARQRDWSEVRTFYARRSLRIFPLYFLALWVCAMFFFPVSWPYWLYLDNFWNLSRHTTLAGPSHFWSLAVEEQFYVVWPFVVLFMPRRHLPKILVFMILLGLALRVWLAAHHKDVFSFTFTRLDGLAGGAILAVLHKRDALQRWRGLLMGTAVVCLIIITVTGPRFRDREELWFTAIKYPLLGAMYTGFLGWVICSPRSWLSRGLSVRPLRFVGRISYGLYVWHPFVLSWVFKALHFRRPALEAALGFPAVFGVACVSYYGFERYFLRLKGRLSPEPRPTPQAPVQV